MTITWGSLTCWTANLVLDYSTKCHQLSCIDSKHLFTHSSNPLQWFPPHCAEANRVNFNTGWKQASCRSFYGIARLSGCQDNENPPAPATRSASKEEPLHVRQGSSKVSTPATVEPDLVYQCTNPWWIVRSSETQDQPNSRGVLHDADSRFWHGDFKKSDCVLDEPQDRAGTVSAAGCVNEEAKIDSLPANLTLGKKG